MRSFLADFGSTSVKIAVYDRESDTVSSSEKLDFPARIPCDNENVTEISIIEIDKIIDYIAKKAVAEKCADMYISVQMHGYILKKDGAFSDYVSWQDKRSLNGWFDKFPKEGIDFTALGTAYKPNLPMISIYNRVQSGELDGAEYFTLGSYIAYRLTGVNKTHITDSAASGFYYADSAKTANVLGYPMTFATSTNKVEVVGSFDGVNVYAPVGDHQVTFLGLDIADGETLLNISTATQISTVSDKLSEDYECRPFFSKGRLCTVSGLVGGMVIRQKQKVGEPYSKELAKELIENYGAALAKMPNSDKLVIGGGATVYFRDLIDAVGSSIGTQYRVTDELSAFKGLVRIIRGDI